MEMRLLFTGGGTLGPVTPLIALHETLRPDAVFWIGTRHGVERGVIERAGIPFSWIFSGKFRRYFSMRHFIDPILILIGFVQSLLFLSRNKPTHIFSAGAFVSVPVVAAGWILRIPCYTMQLDLRPGLANRLMRPFVQNVFCTFKESAAYFGGKAVVVGGVVRSMRTSDNLPVALDDHVPVLLVLGGGTGSRDINVMIGAMVPTLVTRMHIVHLTGSGKDAALPKRARYHALPFTHHLPSLMKRADLVVSRAGMGTLAELAQRTKPVIIVPLPHSHQEDTAKLLADDGAAILVEQKQGATALVDALLFLMEDQKAQKEMGKKLHERIPATGVQKIATFLKRI